MSETTPLLSLPLLQAGQAQKEALHNEAIKLLDAIVTGSVETIGDNAAPVSRMPGQVWIVGSAPIGDWARHADDLAIWTAGGWRFTRPADGMSFRLRSDGLNIERRGATWVKGVIEAASLKVAGQQVVGSRLSGIIDPGGGATIDSEARRAIAAILVTLRTHGLIAT